MVYGDLRLAWDRGFTESTTITRPLEEVLCVLLGNLLNIIPTFGFVVAFLRDRPGRAAIDARSARSLGIE